MKKIVIAVICALLAGLIVITGILAAIGGAVAGEESQSNGAGGNYGNISTDGFPPFITQEMLATALEEQDKHGFPASVTIAQIVAESGYGRYGPGGEVGKGLSGLAFNYKNLFGIKAPAGDSTPIGVVNMQTGEETSNGNITITAGFLIFRNYSDCIRYRSGLIQRRYMDLVGGVTDPDEFARKLGRRWATDSQYANKLIRIMTQYNLYRLNNLSSGDVSDGNVSTDEGAVSSGQRRLLNVATSLNPLGCRQGMCQAWVANVYVKAGQNPRRSAPCATEAGNAYLVSGSRNNIPIGAVIYGAHSWKSRARCGNHDAGHVGIYVGNGKIASLESKVNIKTLDKWISGYGYRGWGWNGNQDFSKIK